MDEEEATRLAIPKAGAAAAIVDGRLKMSPALN
jgi:hypothetical protein